MCKILVIFSIIFLQASSDDYSFINLPDSHLPYYFTNYPQIAQKCSLDSKCPFKYSLNTTRCWGYEYNCTKNLRYSTPNCPGDHRGWVKSKHDQIETFYTQADWGYIKQQLKEIKVLCEPLFIDDSSLECTDHLRFCRGRNLLINFTSLANRDEPIRYKMDVLSDGDIGGYCDFKKNHLIKETDHLSALQSWGPELRFFKKLKRRPIIENDCDIIIEKPTFILKIDATVNMYHHFCDFLNLYASLHLNSSHFDAFSTDVNILIWESYTYNSNFQDTWKAFTQHPILDLKLFRGKSVCFKNLVFPLLPRMIFGLYYNTPLIYGCESSGLFHAFSHHILHRLKINFNKRQNNKIHITLLVRDTKYRRILNDNELFKALKNNSEYEVEKVVFNKNINFKNQLKIIKNTDILIGIHGAGLTHLLFLPDWAAIFEIYNCEDPSCYSDLARLRGVKYYTWENINKLKTFNDGSHDGGAHAKFANYSFNTKEFIRIVKKAANYVKNHKKFKELFNKIKIIHEEL